jgi:ABC-2 type transport system permease protein
MKFIQKTFKLLKRELGILWGNTVLRAIFFGAPVIYTLLLGYVYSSGKVSELPIIVVDEDRSPISNRMIDMLDENETIHVASVVTINSGLKNKMLDENATLVVYIPENFEADILQRHYPEILVDINMANILTANFASRAVQVSLGTLNAGLEAEALRKSGIPYEEALNRYEPFKTTFLRSGNPSGNYMNFLWPGMLATILQQVLLLVAAISFSYEFETGKFETEFRPQVASPGYALFIKITPYLIGSFLISAFFVLAHWLFGVPLSAHPMALILPLLLFTLAVLFLGTLISIWIPNQLKATEVLMVVATPSFVLSGYTWPLEQMPIMVRYFAEIIPLTPFLRIYRTVWVSGGSLSNASTALYSLLIMTFLFGSLAWLSLKFKYYRSRPSKK